MPKRKHKVRKPKPKIVKMKHKLWPVIYCIDEEKVIGVSYHNIGIRHNASGKAKPKSKTDKSHWMKWNSKFLEGYRIDFKEVKKGELVNCPVCGGVIDFRLFPSTTKPKLEDPKVQDRVKEDSEKAKVNRIMKHGLPD